MNQTNLLVATCLALLPACFSVDTPRFDDGIPDAVDGYRVGGEVRGLWAPAGVSLHLAAGGADEVLNVDQDGAFTFPPAFEDGTPYVVTIASQPDSHDCTLPDGTGTIAGADAVVTITCEGPVDVAIDWTAPVPLGFEPLAETTRIDVSTMIREAAVIVTAPGATAIELDGVALNSGVSSETFLLPFGTTSWQVSVEAGAFSRTFQIEVARGAVAPGQVLYGKSSNSDSGDDFGFSIAADGELFVVGAPGESSAAQTIDGDQSDNSADHAGAVYVFRREGTGWTQEAYLKGSRASYNDTFGTSVALSGDVLVVGAPSETGTTDEWGSGAAYIFRRTVDGWIEEAYLEASNRQMNDMFGGSVAISGDRIVIGARGEDSDSDLVDSGQSDDSAETAGAAYVFERTTTWTQTAYLKASNSDSGDQFGDDVAIAGDRIIVTAPKERSNAEGPNGDQSDNSVSEAGAAYVYRRTGGGWVQEMYLKPSTTSAGMLFGFSVALSDAGAVVGAPFDGGSGSVSLFTRSGSDWTADATLRASNADSGDMFGWWVAVAGDLLAVGAPAEASLATGVDGDQSNNDCVSAGAAYLFHHDASRGQLHYLKQGTVPFCPFEGDRFGSVAAFAHGGLVVSAPGDDSDATGLDGDPDNDDAGSSGAIYVFR